LFETLDFRVKSLCDSFASKAKKRTRRGTIRGWKADSRTNRTLRMNRDWTERMIEDEGKQPLGNSFNERTLQQSCASEEMEAQRPCKQFLSPPETLLDIWK
jgi:hypothetical protein